MPHSHGEVVNRPPETIKKGKDIIHGIGNEPLTSHVDRADKTAPLPEPEKGAGIPGMNVAGARLEGHNQGRPGVK